MIETKSLSVDQIREHILKNFNVSPTVINNIKGKSKLINFIASLEKSGGNFRSNDNGFKFEDLDDVFVEEGKDCETETINKISPNWSKYILDQLAEDEKDGNFPKSEGLRRLVEKEISPIVCMETSVIQAPNPDNNMIATVKTTIYLENGQKYDAVADNQQDHCPPPFNKHTSAVAESRSEGRCYRKILRLKNIVTKEEIIEENIQSDTTINKVQKGLINTLCSNSRLNINVKKLFDYTFKDKKEEKIQNYSHEQAAQICKLLSEYQTKMDSIPVEILGFDPSWEI